MRKSRALWLLVAFLCLAQRSWSDPRPQKFDLEIGNMSGFVDSDSFVQVREDQIGGDHLTFPSLGLKTAQIPHVDGRFWLNERNALSFQLRYFVLNGSQFLENPKNFNGATIAGGQTLHSRPVWYSVGLFYDHRWKPVCLGKDGALLASFGLEYTFIDFRINTGHAPVTGTSAGNETKEGFYLQELPIPTFGVRLNRRVSPSFILNASLSGNWINHWNSQRKEGGTIYLSQRKLEAHLGFKIKNEAKFKSFHPLFGLFYYDFRQLEESNEDGNLVHLKMLGPELGIGFEF
jgi:hypothetical protein